MEYSDPQDTKVAFPTDNRRKAIVGRVTPTNAWWDDSRPNKRLYGSRGEVLIDIPGREIGFKKR